jgi:hypothetical protein
MVPVWFELNVCYIEVSRNQGDHCFISKRSNNFQILQQTIKIHWGNVNVNGRISIFRQARKLGPLQIIKL